MFRAFGKFCLMFGSIEFEVIVFKKWFRKID